MNYGEDKLRNTRYIIFLRRGSLRHLVYFKGYAGVKRLKNAAVDNRILKYNTDCFTEYFNEHIRLK